MKLSDFDYHLPAQLIAQYPSQQRGSSRLLRVNGTALEDLQFADIEDLIQPEDLLVVNDTKVIKARLYAEKETGGKLEILIERLLPDNQVLAKIRASKSPKPGSIIKIGNHRVAMLDRQDEFFRLHSPQLDWLEIMQGQGHIPLPPYIERQDQQLDEARYQTVYADKLGAVAAPTAGLHFNHEIMQRLTAKGVSFAKVTLHVGAGTFQPVRVENLKDHVMHAEWLQLSQQVCDQVVQTRSKGGRVIAVGTTSVRSLESASEKGRLMPFMGDTRLFITPGYEFQQVDAMITNFHLPQSTLLMLVSAFAGFKEVMLAYQHAVENNYRFFSYGDAMFLERNHQASLKPEQ